MAGKVATRRVNNITFSIVYYRSLSNLPFGSRLAYMAIVLSSAFLMTCMNCASALSRFAVD